MHIAAGVEGSKYPDIQIHELTVLLLDESRILKLLELQSIHWFEVVPEQELQEIWQLNGAQALDWPSS